MNVLNVRWINTENPSARVYECQWEHNKDLCWQRTVYCHEKDGKYFYAATHPLRLNMFVHEDFLESCVDVERMYRESDPYLCNRIPTIREIGVTG